MNGYKLYNIVFIIIIDLVLLIHSEGSSRLYDD